MNDVGPGSKPSRKAPPGTDEETARVLEGFDLRDAMIMGVAESANSLAKSADNLVAAARLSQMEKVVALSLLVVNTIGMLGIAIVAFLILNLGQTNRDNTTILRECTTPSTPGDTHECFDRNEAATGKAISRLVQTQIVVAECVAVGRGTVPPQTDEQFEACVSERLAKLPTK